MRGVKGVCDEIGQATDSFLESSTTSFMDPCRIFKRENAPEIIISALRDAPLGVLLDADDDPAQMMSLLDGRYASNCTVYRVVFQSELFRMGLVGWNM